MRDAYDWFFHRVIEFCELDRATVVVARQLAGDHGVGGADALHAAAALRCGATEFVTTERRTKPLFSIVSARGLAVRHLSDA